jgi:ankyrin repeat protein
MISQYFYVWYEWRRSSLWSDGYGAASFYFEFDRTDGRYNTIRAMLLSYINEVLWRAEPGSDLANVLVSTLGRLRHPFAWSLPGLFKVFSDLRRQWMNERFTIILGRFDDCTQEERDWFLARVQEEQNGRDTDYGVVFVTDQPEVFLNPSLKENEIISLKDCPGPFRGFEVDETMFGADASELDLGFSRIMGHVKKVSPPTARRLKAELLRVVAMCQGTDPHLGRILLNWLSHIHHGNAIDGILEAVLGFQLVTPQSVFSLVVDSMSGNDRRIANVIHRWTKYAFEPVSTESLGQALAASRHTSSLIWFPDNEAHLNNEIQRLFCGIIITHRGYVKFSHPSFLDMKVEDEEDSYMHGRMADECLQCLLLYGTDEPHERKVPFVPYGESVLQRPLLLPPNDLYVYAARFWTSHYNLSRAHRPFDLAVRLFDDTEQGIAARRAWCETRYLASNPFVRSQQSYVSPLPLLASLGLADMLELHIKSRQRSKDVQLDIWLAIAEAAREGYREIVSVLLKHASLEAAGLQEAIWEAICSGHQDIATDLASLVESAQGFTWPTYALPRAAAAGLEQVVRILLSTGQDVNAKDDSDNTALHNAISWRRGDVLKLLLDHGADLSARDAQGRTASLSAANVGDVTMMQLLLDAGASLEDMDKDGVTVINTAIDAGNSTVLDKLIAAGGDCRAGNADADDVRFQYPIIHAAFKWRRQCLHVLLEKGVDVNTRSKHGSAAHVFFSAIRPSVEECRYLVERGADVNEKSPPANGDYLFQSAVISSKTELLTLLLDHGLRLDFVDGREDVEPPHRTILTAAAAWGGIEKVELLLQRGADVNAVCEGGEHPLFTSAFRQSNVKLTKLLLDKGAKFGWKDEDGWTALHAAYDVPDMLALLMQYGGNVNQMSKYGTPVMLAARWGFDKSLEVLLGNKESMPDLSTKFDWDSDDVVYGWTALQLAIDGKHVKCAKLLLEAGAILEEKFKNIKSVLNAFFDQQSKEGLADLLQLCFDAGARADVVEEGDTEYNTALHSLGPGAPISVAQILVEWGAPVNKANAKGLTPLGVALHHGNDAVARYLLSRGARGDVYGTSFGTLLHVACDSYALSMSGGENMLLSMMKLLIKFKADPTAAGPAPYGDSILTMVIGAVLNLGVKYAVVRYLVEELRVPLNKRGADESSPEMLPIFTAITQRDDALVEYLLDHGADPHSQDSEGGLLTHYAAIKTSLAPGDPAKLFRLLIKLGVDTRTPDRFGRTPLHYAAYSSTLDIIRLILGQIPPGEFDVNVRDKDGWTPLMWAVRFGAGAEEVVRELVTKHAADVRARSNNDEWSVIRLAHMFGWTEGTSLIPGLPRTEEELSDREKQDIEKASLFTSPAFGGNGGECSSCLMVSSDEVTPINDI